MTLQTATHVVHDERINAGSDADVFTGVLGDVVDALANVEYGVIGGVASTAYGRPRWTKDIDVFLRAADAPAALAALAGAGFETEETNPSWIFKGFRNGVLVDVIFKTKADVYFDDQMAARVRVRPFAGIAVPLASPEDIVVCKALAADEEAPWHWHDALGIIAVNELDWDYLIERARKSPNRVLSLLHYAESVDLPIPMRALATLHDTVARRWAA